MNFSTNIFPGSAVNGVQGIFVHIERVYSVGMHFLFLALHIHW